MREGAFRNLWTTSTASFLALSSYLLFEQWYVVDQLGQHAGLGAVMVATALPRILLMTLGGVLVDRFGASRLAAVSAGTRLVTVIGMIICLAVNVLGFWLLLVFAALYGICDAFFSPAVNSLAPRLVAADQLKSANAILQGSNQAAMVIGPVLGALLLAISYEATLIVVAGLLLIASGAAVLIAQPPVLAAAGSRRLFADLGDSVRLLWGSKAMRDSMALVILVNIFFSAPLQMGPPLLVAGGLGGDPTDLGFLQGSYACGMILGAIIAGVSPIIGQPVLFRIMISALGLFLLGLGLVDRIWLAACLMLSMGLISSVINVLLITRIQEQTPPGSLGRIMGLVSVLSSGLLPLSYAALGLVVGAGVRVNTVLVGSGAAICVIAVIAVATAIRPGLRRGHSGG